jgi:hypothetical protein
VRSETVVGAGDIAFRRCRTFSNGLLDDRPIQPRGLHGGLFRGPPQKDDRMPANEHVPISVDEVISEIATILARGYMRYRNGRRLAIESDTEAAHVAPGRSPGVGIKNKRDDPLRHLHPQVH